MRLPYTRHWSAKRAILVVALALGLVLLPAAVFASNFGSRVNNGPYQDYFYYQLTDAFINETTWTRSQNLNPTKIDTARIYDHDSSEVSVMDDPYDQTWYGIAECNVIGPYFNGLASCQHWHIRYNLNKSWTQTKRRHVTCQETGHSIGLKHDTTRTTCMNDSNLVDTYFSGHDDRHIEAFYP